MAQILAGSMLVFQDGTKVPAEEHLKDKIVALYFSAGWCGPCQQFTPVLKAIFPFHFSFQDMNIQKFYDDLKEEGINNFEIVFLSWDENADEQEQYFRDVHGRWARLDYSDPKNKLDIKSYDHQFVCFCLLENFATNTSIRESQR
jgi:nucleoredoxin